MGLRFVSMNSLACLQINGNAFCKDVWVFRPLKYPNRSSCFVSLLDANGHSVNQCSTSFLYLQRYFCAFILKGPKSYVT